MSVRFSELDWQRTPRGEVSLRRRREPVLDVDVFEVKLGDEFLMSSLFTVAEVELARLGLAAVEPGVAGSGAAGASLDVLVGGLGLGCTAAAALADARVGALHVLDALEPVIDWHRRGLLPLSDALTSDARCHLVLGDFFSWAAGADLPGLPARWHAVLLDVDHSPRHLLHPDHAPFYEPTGLRRLDARLHPGGVFALWSDDPPEEEFLGVLREVFVEVEAHVVSFDNPFTGAPSMNTVYVGKAQP